jgi:mannose-6-phosphate isomerase-like protein (cupin superfamily)
MQHPINFAEKLARFDDHWAPRVVAEMNDYQFKLVKFEGEFDWHLHVDADEAFIVLAGEMEIDVNTGDAGGELTAQNDAWI